MNPDQSTAVERQRLIMAHLEHEYARKLDEDMGKLHNQFVAFVASAGIPLPNVLLVIEILKKEIIEQSISQYLGE